MRDPKLAHILVWSSWRAKKDAVKQKVLSFHEDGQKGKMVIKIEFTPLSLPDCTIFSLKRVLKNKACEARHYKRMYPDNGLKIPSSIDDTNSKKSYFKMQ